VISARFGKAVELESLSPVTTGMIHAHSYAKRYIEDRALWGLAAQRLRRSADLARDRPNRCRPGILFVLTLKHHPCRRLSHLR
jgi:hypothetical protein